MSWLPEFPSRCLGWSVSLSPLSALCHLDSNLILVKDIWLGDPGWGTKQPNSTAHFPKLLPGIKDSVKRWTRRMCMITCQRQEYRLMHWACASSRGNTQQMLLMARERRGDPGPHEAGKAASGRENTKTVLHLHFNLTGIIIKPSALPVSAWQGYLCSTFLDPLPSFSFIVYLDVTLLSLLHFNIFFFFFNWISHRERVPQ